MLLTVIKVSLCYMILFSLDTSENHSKKSCFETEFEVRRRTLSVTPKSQISDVDSAEHSKSSSPSPNQIILEKKQVAHTSKQFAGFSPTFFHFFGI